MANTEKEGAQQPTSVKMTAENKCQHEPEDRSQQADTQSHGQGQAFGNGIHNNLRFSFQSAEAVPFGSHQSLGKDEQDQKATESIFRKLNDGRGFPNVSNRPFGQPAPLDPRFEVQKCESLKTPVAPTLRGLEDAFKDNPEVVFYGMSQNSLNFTGNALIQIVDEMLVKWLHEWYSGSDIPSIFGNIRAADFLDVDLDKQYIVPAKALNVKPTGTTLAQLFRNCVHARNANPEPQATDIVMVAHHCVILCQVLKEEEIAGHIDMVKKVLSWLDVSLGCKLLGLKQEVARDLAHIASLYPTVVRAKEKTLLKALVDKHEVNRAESSSILLAQLKELTDYTNQHGYHPIINLNIFPPPIMENNQTAPNPQVQDHSW
ncbi:hypothetical protein F4804DRAFT_330911 [Jackrogersella minutella]|nr:hypothetical protein F4804DRAFT_330911 [Jackrogersella minutella]